MIRSRIVAGALAALLLAAVPAAADEARVTFLHFNDVYEFMPAGDIGGLAAVKAVADRERAAHPGAVFTFGGDLLSPSVASSLTHGAHMVDMLNHLDLAAAVLGNHEFDFGADVLHTRMAESRFPWLVTNVSEPDGTPFAGAPRLMMLERNGIKIGLFGVLTVESASLSAGGRDARFQSETDAARAAVQRLREQGAELVVALTHVDVAQDVALARQVKGIDLILGGHDHNAVTIEEGSTLIVKAGHDGVWLAAVDMVVDRAATPRVRSAGWRLLPTRGEAGDPELAAIAQRYAGEMDAAMDVPLASLAATLDSRQEAARGGESSFGDFVADSLREALNADIALINGGGLRGNRLYPAGSKLTRADIVREMPFGNTVMLLEVSGSDILAALEQGVSKAPALAGRFPQVAGLSFSYDAKAPVGRRVLNASLGGAPIEPARRYRLATTDYLADGGDGYTMLKNGRVLIDRAAAPLLSNVVMDHAQRLGTITPPPGGRIRSGNE
ncbi:MAG: bifunctional metallophosphatase/5'-nucleotidase [Bacteroidota bacterium]